MKNIMYFLALSCALVSGQEAKPIFDGKTLDGWNVKGPTECWSVTDGGILGKNNEKKQGSILWTNESYSDFVFEAEFQFSDKIDSGFFLKNESEQIQLGISGSLKCDMTCSPYIGKKGIYPVAAVGVDKLLKVGEWNQIKITVKGKKYIVVLNGKQVLDYTTDEALDKGPLGLQVHPGVVMQVMFRNLKIKSL